MGIRSNLFLCFIVAQMFSLTWSRQPLLKAPKGAVKTGCYIVALKDGATESDLKEVIAKIKDLSNEVDILRYTDVIQKTVTVKAPRDVLEKIRDFTEISHIEEEDIAYGSQEAGAVTQAQGDKLWFLNQLNYPGFSKAEEVVDVYVLDTGIQYEHTEFESRAKYAGYDPVDQSNIGTSGYKPQRGRDCNGHGTLVASLIGGKTYGIAKEVNLFSVRVIGCDQAAPWSVILDGLNFVASEVNHRRRPAIVSMALSGSRHPSVDMAINFLHNMNVLVVASAGNSHKDACSQTPASNSRVLTVGSTTQDNRIHPRSNFGACVDVFAPGESISGAEYTCPTCTVDGASGTSLAAALVCGIAAVHLSRSPLIDPAQLKQKIIDISSIGRINFHSLQVGFQESTPNRLASAECGSVLRASESAKILQSPNFPGNYPNSVECTWTIVAEEDKQIELVFKFIKLEDGYDSLTIKQDSSNVGLTGDYGEVMCGYVSTDPLTVQLHTDETTTSTGFRAFFKTVTSSSVEGCVNPTTNDALQLDVLSEGPNVGNRFSMSRDWQEFFAGRRVGVNLAVLHEDSGEVALQRTFDIAASQQASIELAKTIENIHPGSLVALSTSGGLRSYNDLDARTKRAISTIGSSHAPSVQLHSSWALVGVKGIQEGTALERVSGSSAVDISTQLKLQRFRQLGVPIEVKSAGEALGNYATILVDGIQARIESSSGTNTGLNVVVIEGVTGTVLHSMVFSTHSQAVTDTSPSDDFVDFINSLPNGRVVAIAIKGDAIGYLSENAKRACEAIGSRYIRQIQVGGSWAIVGRKGAAIGTVSESGSNCKDAQTIHYLPEDPDSDNLCRLSVTTSGFVSGTTNRAQCYLGGLSAYVSVGDQVRPARGSFSRGLTLAVVNQHMCAIDTLQTFDTYDSESASQQLVSFLNGIPQGQVVIGTAFDEATRRLSTAAKVALENIGSAQIRNVGIRDAWAIIGRKGAPRGSVPETHDTDTSSIGYHAPLRVGSHLLVKSAGTRMGDYASIVVNGKEEVSANTGLNAVILDQDSGNVLYKLNFKTHSRVASSDDFVNFINSLPNGRVVAIAIKGDAIAHLSENAKRACEAIGSRYIRQIQVGGSWAIVGRKGAPIGTVPESGRNCKDAQAFYYLPQHHDFDNLCGLSVTTSGFVSEASMGAQCNVGGLSAYVSVGDQARPVRRSFSRGITLAVVNQHMCAIDTLQTFDTHSSESASQQLVSFLNGIPQGQVVIATAFDEATHRLSTAAKVALENIGSAQIRNVGYRDAWAIIGRKGAPRGSVVETHDPDTSSIGGSIYLPSSCDNALYPLNCRAELSLVDII